MKIPLVKKLSNYTGYYFVTLNITLNNEEGHVKVSYKNKLCYTRINILKFSDVIINNLFII